MYQFLCLFSSLLTYVFFVQIKKEKRQLTIQENIQYFSYSLVVTIFLIHLCIYLLNGIVDMSYNVNHITNTFMMKYVLLTLVVSIASAWSILFIDNVLSKFSIKSKNNNIKRDKKITRINVILICVFIILFFGAFYMLNYYRNVPAEQLMYHLQVPLGGTSSEMIKDVVSKIVTPIVIAIALLLLLVIPHKKKVVLEHNNKEIFVINPLRLDLKKITLITIILMITLLGVFSHKYNLVSFIQSQFVTSSFIEDNYVNPKNVDVSFPDKKKNLIHIYIESMESTYMDKNSGGLLDYNLIPNLQKLAEEETNFSNNASVGGFMQTIGTNWTIAGMVAQTSGLPLKFSTDSSNYDVKNDSFLNGVTALGDILKDNGYKNYLYLGSAVAFAGRDKYFAQHGEYEVFDYDAAILAAKIPEDYKVWWGYEDKKLYEYSREKLLEISKKDEPFNFTILTVDNHPNGGYLDETCDAPYDSNIENVIKCSDKMAIDFINWIKRQDFYKDTTVIITGDHANMDSSFISTNGDRYVYDAILNPSVQPIKEKNRKITPFDMFPTTLASMGVKIEGDKLGLGTNLFSNKETLAEKYGIDKINDELEKKSSFYQNMSLYDK